MFCQNVHVGAPDTSNNMIQNIPHRNTPLKANMQWNLKKDPVEKRRVLSETISFLLHVKAPARSFSSFPGSSGNVENPFLHKGLGKCHRPQLGLSFKLPVAPHVC